LGGFQARTPLEGAGNFRGLMGSSIRGPAVPYSALGTEAAFTPRFGLDSTPSRSGGDDSIESLRQQLRALQEENAVLNEKLNAVVQAIGAKNADKIVHDIRNLLNELVLLRKLAELEE